MSTHDKKGRKWMYIIAPVVVIFLLLAYYQLLYKSPEVNSDIATLKTTFTGHRSDVQGIKFIPNTNLVATASADSMAYIWNRETGEVVKALQHPTMVTYIDISPDGKYAATTALDGIVRLWDVQAGTLVRELKGHEKRSWHACFSPNGKKLVTSDEAAVAIIWDVESGAILHRLKGHELTIWSVKFSRDGNTVATASFDHTLKFWNVADGKLIKTINAHSQAIVDIAYSHDGNTLASTSDDKTIKLWNVADVSLIRTMEVAEHVQGVVFSPGDKTLLTSGRDKPLIGEFLQEIFGDSRINKGISARLWDVRNGKLLQTFKHHENDVNDVAYSDDGKWIATASSDRTACVYAIRR
jgi:WD40 repeat protein